MFKRDISTVWKIHIHKQEVEALLRVQRRLLCQHEAYDDNTATR
jgi:hypothetical protein